MPKSERRTKVPKSLGLWKIGARESSMFKLEGIMYHQEAWFLLGIFESHWNITEIVMSQENCNF